MRNRRILTLMLGGCLAIGMSGCDVDVEDQGEMPDVQVDPGRAPDVDVHGPDVDVENKEKTVTVPDVDVDMKEKQVEVPDVDIDLPSENDN